MERTHAIREDCPNCGSVAVDTTQVTLYHSVHEGKFVAALEFECPSPTHPQPITAAGELDVNRSRYVRYPIDTIAAKYQTPQFMSNVRRVNLKEYYSKEQDDPKRAAGRPPFTQGLVDNATALYLKAETQIVLDAAILEMRREQQIGEPTRRVRLFDRVRDRLKRKPK